MSYLVGHIRLTHITDGVLHGKIIPLSNPEVGPLWGIAEFDLSKSRLTAFRVTPIRNSGFFGPIGETGDLNDIPIASPRKLKAFEITEEMLEKALAYSQAREKEGWLAPVYFE